MKQSSDSSNLRAAIWLACCTAIGSLLVALYPDSHQQDGGFHFLFARWGWNHPEFFVMVWNRPLFTFLYSFPAHLGYTAARILTVTICVLTAWQTWRTARLFELPRAELVVPFLFFQPSFFLLSHETMTEPLFALTFITALRFHLSGKIKLGALFASLLILSRPEGFFIGILWGVWLLFDARAGVNLFQRIPTTLILATGGVIWILASWCITGDPLFIKHNWPSDWEAAGALYGTGTIFTYVIRSPEIVGLFLLPPFIFGLVKALREKTLVTITSSFLVLFVLHTIFRKFGLFSSAGYPRYFVCVSPAVALLTLYGWNEMSERLKFKNETSKKAFAASVILVSMLVCFLYNDAASWNRDAEAIIDAHSHFNQSEHPISHFYWSHAFMGIVFDRDNSGQPLLSRNKEQNLEILKNAPKGTLVFWDAILGPKYSDIKADEIIAVGYKNLYSQSYVLKGHFLRDWWNYKYGKPRPQEMYLLYKE